MNLMQLDGAADLLEKHGQSKIKEEREASTRRVARENDFVESFAKKATAIRAVSGHRGSGGGRAAKVTAPRIPKFPEQNISVADAKKCIPPPIRRSGSGRATGTGRDTTKGSPGSVVPGIVGGSARHF